MYTRIADGATGEMLKGAIRKASLKRRQLRELAKRKHRENHSRQSKGPGVRACQVYSKNSTEGGQCG